MMAFFYTKGIPMNKYREQMHPLLLIIFLLTSCNMPRIKPTAIPVSTDLPYTQCAWNWATQSLPELSTKVEGGIQAAGLKNVTVSAEAYGENCITTAGKVDHFAAMQTDFYIVAKVENLTDIEKLGSLLEGILVVLDGFPNESTPGPNPGYVGMTFRKGSEELNLWFPVTAGESARARGSHGAVLFEELHNK
jgi:hypothetical protein